MKPMNGFLGGLPSDLIYQNPTHEIRSFDQSYTGFPRLDRYA